MPFPPPSPGVQIATLFCEENRSPTQNSLRVYALGLPALRRVRVAMKVSPMVNQLTVPIRWWANCRATLKFPRRDLAPVGVPVSSLPAQGPAGGSTDVHLSPSLVIVPSLGAPVMAIFDVFLPTLPLVDYVTIYFSTENKDPSAQCYVFGYPDGGRHDYDGFFLTPYGSGVYLRRTPGDGGDDDDEHALELEEVNRDTRQDALERINPKRRRKRD